MEILKTARHSIRNIFKGFEVLELFDSWFEQETLAITSNPLMLQWLVIW